MQGPGTAGSGRGAGSRTKHVPLGAAWDRPSPPRATMHGRAWTGILHPLPVTVHPSSATRQPAVLCPLRMPGTSLHTHQHFSLGGQDEMSEMPVFLTSWSKTNQQAQGGQADAMVAHAALRASRPLPVLCQGLKPLALQPAEGSGGGGGSCTAPPWPRREVQVAQNSRVPPGWGAGSSLQQNPRNSQRGLHCLSPKKRSPCARPSEGCHRPLRAAR